MPDQFNLVENPWIPVRLLNRQPRLLSLREVFLWAREIADLNAASPARIALMRLLVCVTQAALGAPATPAGWEEFGEDLSRRAADYLNHPATAGFFELFGAQAGFLQMPVEERREPVSVSKWFPHLATGANATVFDHAGGTRRRFPAAELALALLCFQNHHPIYGAGYMGTGPCVRGNMLHVLLIGNNLRETILLNCLDQRSIDEHWAPAGMGRPLWELDPQSEGFEETATRSWLGRLVPRHRNLRIRQGAEDFDLARESLNYTSGAVMREGTSVLVAGSEPQESKLLAARAGRRIWRDLAKITLTGERGSPEAARGSLTIQSHRHQLGSSFTLWTGGTVTDYKAKVLDVVEAVFRIPPVMTSRAGAELYASGVAMADQQAAQLRAAVKNHTAALRISSNTAQISVMKYWESVNRSHQALLDAVANKPTSAHPGDPLQSWHRLLRDTAVGIFNTAIGRTRTMPRPANREAPAVP